jgi:hypothetical protein
MSASTNTTTSPAAFIAPVFRTRATDVLRGSVWTSSSSPSRSWASTASRQASSVGGSFDAGMTTERRTDGTGEA